MYTVSVYSCVHSGDVVKAKRRAVVKQHGVRASAQDMLEVPFLGLNVEQKGGGESE